MIRVRPIDNRWKGRQDELCQILDEQMSKTRMVFGAYNNALFLLMGEAIDKVRKIPGYGQRTKRDVNALWKTFKAYESNLRFGESNMMKMKGLAPDARAFYADGTTDNDLFDYWCATGSYPYTILKKWTCPLANKYKIFLTSRGVHNPEAASWLMTIQNLFAFQEDIWKRVIVDLSVPNGLMRAGIESALSAFRMNNIAKAWWKLLRDVCPELNNIHPDDMEEKNIHASMQDIIEHVDSDEFYFGGVREATEEYNEVFRTRGWQKKALRQMADARAEWEKRIE